MKKTLMIAGLMSLLLASTVTFAADTAQTEKAVTNPTANNEQIRPPRPPKFDKQKMEEFQNKLGLTDEQKAKAKLIHEQGREQMKPVMDKMMAKHEAIKAIKENTALTEEQKTAEIQDNPFFAVVGGKKNRYNQLLPCGILNADGTAAFPETGSNGTRVIGFGKVCDSKGAVRPFDTFRDRNDHFFSHEYDSRRPL